MRVQCLRSGCAMLCGVLGFALTFSSCVRHAQEPQAQRLRRSLQFQGTPQQKAIFAKIDQLFKSRDYPGVVAFVEQARSASARLDPLSKRYYALALSYTGRLKAAQPLLQEIYDSEADGEFLGEVRIQLAQCYTGMGQKDRADALYRGLVADIERERIYYWRAKKALGVSVKEWEPQQETLIEIDLAAQQGNLVEAWQATIHALREAKSDEHRELLQARQRRIFSDMRIVVGNALLSYEDLLKKGPLSPGKVAELRKLGDTYAKPLPLLNLQDEYVRLARKVGLVKAPERVVTKSTDPAKAEVRDASSDQGATPPHSAEKDHGQAPAGPPLTPSPPAWEAEIDNVVLSYQQAVGEADWKAVHERLVALLKTPGKERAERLLEKVEGDLAQALKKKAADHMNSAKDKKKAAERLKEYVKAHELLSQILTEYRRNASNARIEQDRNYVRAKIKQINPGYFK